MREFGKLSGSETLEQARQHFLYFEQFAFEFLVSADFEHSEVSREQKKILKFTSRPHGDVKKLSEFRTTTTAATFRDVCGDGTGSSPDLAAQTKAFIGRKFPGEFVCTKGHSVTPAPNLQLAEVLHDPTSLNHLKVLRNYLQLNTNNCQLFCGGCHAD